MKHTPEQLAQIRQKAAEIIRRLNDEHDPLLQEVQANPVQALQHAGLPSSSIGFFLQDMGFPSQATRAGLTATGAAQVLGAEERDLCLYVATVTISCLCGATNDCNHVRMEEAERAKARLTFHAAPDRPSKAADEG